MISLSFFSYCLTAMSPSSRHTRHCFLPKSYLCYLLSEDCRRPWHKFSLGKHQEKHLWVQLKSQFLRSAGTMWWGLRWDRNHSWPGDQDNFTVQPTTCISTSVWSIILATNFPQEQQQKQKKSSQSKALGTRVPHVFLKKEEVIIRPRDMDHKY